MGRPPPIIRAMPERKRFFSIDPFPKKFDTHGVTMLEIEDSISSPDELLLRELCWSVAQASCQVANTKRQRSSNPSESALRFFLLLL